MEASIPSMYHSFPLVHAFLGMVCTMPDLLKSALNGQTDLQEAQRLPTTIRYELVTEEFPPTHFSGKSQE